MDKDKAQELASFLRQLAELLETRPTMFELPKKPSNRKGQGSKSKIDPFDILVEEGELGLSSRLQRLSSNDLKKLIRDNRLDSTGLSNKWNDRKRLFEFALERLMKRQKHGRVFMDPDEPSEQLSQ